ncbi:MAG: ski2-like helicase [bacterium ADurb.Bin236]|nr:MAG: ski2-like helicase [bacterium ADurb.Bin236]
MRPEQQSKRLLGITYSKAKMYEYAVPLEDHIEIPRDPAELFALTIGLLGDYSSEISVGNGRSTERIDELSNYIPFSARFFDAYLQSRLDEHLDPYLLLIGASAYYLSDMPGSASVLASYFQNGCPDLSGDGLEQLLLWILKANFSNGIKLTNNRYDKLIERISYRLASYFSNGEGSDKLLLLLRRFREIVYNTGTPRQLLFSDVITSITIKRIQNSTWNSLPQYTDLSVEAWAEVIKKASYIRELWPAQHLIGTHGVYRGRSAVIQMPTSAGKTRASEIIIRSAFLSGRTSLAIIVAPFRALCHEIHDSLLSSFKEESISIDELSDVLQRDFDIKEFLGKKQILVVTPEKLFYILRQSPEIATCIGLIIYDEGHQFDSGTRGVTYELLLTSLKRMIPDKAQTILISAVISNAEMVNKWLNGDEAEVVKGSKLAPTYRTVAFTSWLDQRGRLEFVEPNELDTGMYFVPRVIEQHEIDKIGRERNARVFPRRDDGKDIALFLGLKICGNGSVAVFCGRKDVAANICEKVVDIYERNLPIPKPSSISDALEIDKLHYIHLRNLGADAVATLSSNIGVFAHHGNTPHGIRLAIEHALQKGLVHFVACTSTLAQGVNFPVRYLIVTSIYQGEERIKVRDFHNLIGRAGRSGMYTEGSIIFADTEVYDTKHERDKKWKWNQIKDIMNPENSEPCASSLLAIFEPLKSDDSKYILKMGPLDLARLYVESPDELPSFEITTELKDAKFSLKGIKSQISYKLGIIYAIESFLMTYWDGSNNPDDNSPIENLAQGTLAYFLAGDEQKNHIIELFKILSKHIVSRIEDVERRKSFGKSMYGVKESLEIEEWTVKNYKKLALSKNQNEMLILIWPLMARMIKNNTFNKCNPPDILMTVAGKWINGEPYFELFNCLRDSGLRLGFGERPRAIKLDHAVDICENALSFDGSLVLGAIIEVLRFYKKDDGVIENLEMLQKRMKYGLPSHAAVSFYEIGFSDRAIAMDLCELVEMESSLSRQQIGRIIRKEKKKAKLIINKYPSYYSERLNVILG